MKYLFTTKYAKEYTQRNTKKIPLCPLRNLFALFAVTVFFSCGNEQEKDFPPTPQDPKDSVVNAPKNMEEDFTPILKEINITNINQYIHPEKGLWLIQSSGAMPNMTNTTQVDKNFPVDFANVKNEELPKVNCDSKSFWTKEGCFVQEVNSFKDEKIWTYCGLNKEDEVKVSELARTISWTVINTSLYARYYFSLIDGKWYLAFVDLRTPCSA
ncbi:MAG: hypothetical protein HY841_15650 [Bacteroidetes bacterium]|nr:hypothetical protein [Bacteroidota bacterium]